MDRDTGTTMKPIIMLASAPTLLILATQHLNELLAILCCTDNIVKYNMRGRTCIQTSLYEVMLRLELGGIPVFNCITILKNADIGYHVY